MSLFLLLCTVARIVFRIGWSLGVRVEGEPGGGGCLVRVCAERYFIFHYMFLSM